MNIIHKAVLQYNINIIHKTVLLEYNMNIIHKVVLLELAS